MEGLVAEAARHFRGGRTLVTGAAGFIGRRLTAVLARAGAAVNVVEASAADLGPLRDLLPQIQVYQADLRDPETLRQAVATSQPEYVFHLAAVGVTDPFLPLEQALEVNLNGTLNLFRACFETAGAWPPPVRLIHTGTPYEYGDGPRAGREPGPINPYAASKAAAFALARMFQRTEGWPIVTVRPFQVYGPGQPKRALIPAAILAARAGQALPMTGGEQRRDFVYLDDVVCGYLLAAVRGVDGSSYDLGWGVAHSVRSVIDRLYALMQVSTRPDYGALPYRPGEIWEMVAEPGPAEQELGWTVQISLDEGLGRTVLSYDSASG